MTDHDVTITYHQATQAYAIGFATAVYAGASLLAGLTIALNDPQQFTTPVGKLFVFFVSAGVIVTLLAYTHPEQFYETIEGAIDD